MGTVPPTLILPPRTLSGAGSSTSLLPECEAFGENGILVHGRSLRESGRLDRIMATKPDGMRVETYQHPGGEPTIAQVEGLLALARPLKPGWIAAVGGGSVIDAAKTCAGLLNAERPLQEYHDGAEIVPSRLPFIAVPTTAGTGSECTSVCVLTNEQTGSKKSIRHPCFMAQLVILDQDLLKSCPPELTANSGMDAFTQAVESFFSLGASWFSDKLAAKAAVLVADSIEGVFRGEHGARYSDLMFGSYLAGMALSNARLGLVHGLAHPLGSVYHLPHGLVCAACLGPVIQFNREAAADKYEILSAGLGDDLLKTVSRLNKALKIKNPFKSERLSGMELIISETLASGSTKSNPRPVVAGDIEDLLKMLFTG